MRIELITLTYSLGTLEDPSSWESKRTARRLAKVLEQQLNQHIPYKPNEVSLETEVREIRRGSVIADIAVYLTFASAAYTAAYVFVKDYDKLKSNLFQIAKDLKEVKYSSYIFWSTTVSVTLLKDQMPAPEIIQREIKKAEKEVEEAKARAAEAQQRLKELKAAEDLAKVEKQKAAESAARAREVRRILKGGGGYGYGDDVAQGRRR